MSRTSSKPKVYIYNEGKGFVTKVSTNTTDDCPEVVFIRTKVCITPKIKQEKQLSNLGVGRASPRKIYIPREKSAAVIAKERAATDENYDAAAEYQKWKNTHIRLNFTLYSAKSRNSQVWDICEDKDRTFTEKDLEI